METVLFTHSVGVIGGAERVTLATIEGIKGKYNSALLSPDGQLQIEAKKAGANCFSMAIVQPEKRHPIRTYLQTRAFIKLLKKIKPIAVHTGDILVLRAMQNACRSLSIPIVCHVHFPYEAPFMQWVFNSSSPVESFIYCSQELKDNIGPALGELVPSANHHVIHNGIDVDRFTPDSTDSSQVFRVGIIANLQERKGHEDFLEMAQKVSEDAPNTHFDIIGGDILQAPREPLLRGMAEKLGIAQSVSFHGQVNNVLSLLQALDIVVCASHEEAFPITILEAMACQKAIVSTNVNGIPEAIEDGISGLLVPPHRADLLAEKVLLLIHNQEMKATLAASSRQRVVEHFSKGIYAQKIVNLYQSLAKS